MPKETIGQSGNKKIDVQWGRIGDPDPKPSITTWVEELGVDGDHADWRPETSWVFDRDELNNLIRVLRRARDMAYGEDA